MSVKDEDVKQKICLALDVSSIKDVGELIKQSIDYVGTYKVGKELFISHGLDSVKEIHRYEKNIFLDLKLHDIPNTVENASRAIVKHNVKMFTIHALGGSEMIKASSKGISAGAKLYANAPPLLLGVTILTSFTNANLNEILIKQKINNSTLHLAKIALENGCAGIVCSAKDLLFLRPKLGNDIFYATPGIETGPKNNLDQKRTANPYEAISNNSSLIIIGRSIINSKEREDTLRTIFEEVRCALKDKPYPNEFRE